MFKEKTSKKRIAIHDTAKDTSTLDARHQSMITSLQENHTSVQSLQNKHSKIIKDIIVLKDTIHKFKLNDETESKEYNLAWSSNLLLHEIKKSIEENIARIQSSQDEIDYFENTGYILFQYYDLIDKQNIKPDQNVPIISQPRVPSKGRKKLSPPASITILDALRINGNDEICPNSSNISIENSTENRPIDKATLVDEYLAQIDSTHVKAKNHDALGNCPTCKVQLICVQSDGAMVCSDCGYQELLLIEQNRPLLRQPNKEASHYSYKRINHFREWCSQVQGKESTDIPEEIFEQILQEIKKEKIHDTKKITYIKMREIMKRLRINKYYEHIHYIINRINGVPTPHFSPDLEEKLCSMFKEIQGPFLKHCPSNRKNFLSYSYVLYKFFQILNMHEYLRFFPLLKSREKLWVQDQIFKNICVELNWPFFPSL
jgi:hypothetical protein